MILIALLALLATYLPHPAAAASPKSLSDASLDIVIFAGNYPPFNIQKEGFIDGLGPAIVHEVFKRMNQQFTLRALPWNRAMETMHKGEADAVLSLFKTPEREIFLIYPEAPLFMESNSFFTTRDSGITFNGDLEEFRGIPISVVEGYSYGTAVDSADFLDLRTSVGDQQMIRMVLRHRYPVGIGNRHVVSHYASIENLEKEIVFLEPFVTNSPAYIAFAKKRHLEGFAETFSNALQAFKQSERYEELLAEHGIY